jgi:crotonobetainyl-CoA:carnitine CoA-transferase CaiB-like acyl-CoA transferase
VDSPKGTIKALVPPVTMQGVEPRMDPIPAVGQHTRAVLRELGFGDSFIARLQQDQAI